MNSRALTDPPIDSYEFLNGFSLALRGQPLPRVPHSLLYALALVGDGMRSVGLRAPFGRDRMHRMMSGHLGRFETLWEECGYRPISLPDAIAQTTAWLRQTYPKRYR